MGEGRILRFVGGEWERISPQTGLDKMLVRNTNIPDVDPYFLSGDVAYEGPDDVPRDARVVCVQRTDQVVAVLERRSPAAEPHDPPPSLAPAAVASGSSEGDDRLSAWNRRPSFQQPPSLLTSRSNEASVVVGDERIEVRF